MRVSTLENQAESATARGGFTLIELLALTAVIVLLLMMWIPARAESRTRSQSVRCLDNLRQIMGAFLMYTHDNHDLFPPNPDDGNLIGHNWCRGMAGVGGGQEFNPEVLADPAQCLITTYLNTNVTLFRCTADLRTGRYQGTNVALIGATIPAARTISMSQAVGTICPGYNAGGSHSGKPTLPVNGPWLTGSYGGNSARNGPWRTYGTTSSMVVPIPAGLWIVMEEEPLSINDAGLAVCMALSEWIDFPGTLHNLAGVIAFGDGHTELHKWRNPAMRLTRSPSGIMALPPGDRDWPWVTARTSARVR